MPSLSSTKAFDKFRFLSGRDHRHVTVSFRHFAPQQRTTIMTIVLPFLLSSV
jgi:hypothetical protein